jgi:hypothetical protein
VTALDAPRRTFLLGPPTQDRDDGERRVRGLARLCAAMRPEWDATQQPFVRPVIDLGAMLGALVVDVNGTLVGPQAAVFWARVFEPGTLPSSAAKWTEQVARADTRQSGCCGRCSSRHRHVAGPAAPSGSRSALRRLRPRARPGVRACHASVIDLPALALVLERIGVRDAETFASAAAAAPGLVHAESADRARVTVLQFQGALALIDRARFSAALDDARAVALVESLLVSLPTGRLRGCLADWITADLMPPFACERLCHCQTTSRWTSPPRCPESVRRSARLQAATSSSGRACPTRRIPVPPSSRASRDCGNVSAARR